MIRADVRRHAASRITFPRERKYNMRGHLLCFVFLVGFYGCLSNPTDGGGSQSVTLVGQWLWVQSSGGIQGKIVTPPAGERSTVTFTSDGKYYSYLNDTLKHSTSYNVSRDKTIYSRDSLDVIVFQDSSMPNMAVIQLTNVLPQKEM